MMHRDSVGYSQYGYTDEEDLTMDYSTQSLSLKTNMEYLLIPKVPAFISFNTIKKPRKVCFADSQLVSAIRYQKITSAYTYISDNHSH